jgi:hypothetical protein
MKKIVRIEKYVHDIFLILTDFGLEQVGAPTVPSAVI